MNWIVKVDQSNGEMGCWCGLNFCYFSYSYCTSDCEIFCYVDQVPCPTYAGPCHEKIEM